MNNVVRQSIKLDATGDGDWITPGTNWRWVLCNEVARKFFHIPNKENAKAVLCVQRIKRNDKVPGYAVKSCLKGSSLVIVARRRHFLYHQAFEILKAAGVQPGDHFMWWIEL